MRKGRYRVERGLYGGRERQWYKGKRMWAKWERGQERSGVKKPAEDEGIAIVWQKGQHNLTSKQGKIATNITEKSTLNCSHVYLNSEAPCEKKKTLRRRKKSTIC